MRLGTRISIIGVIISAIAALVSAMLASGSDIKLAFVITVFFSGFAGGASVVSLICKARKREGEGKD